MEIVSSANKAKAPYNEALLIIKIGGLVFQLSVCYTCLSSQNVACFVRGFNTIATTADNANAKQ